MSLSEEVGWGGRSESLHRTCPTVVNEAACFDLPPGTQGGLRQHPVVP